MAAPAPSTSILEVDDLDPQNQPMFRAIAYSTKAICQILKCINFVPKVHVRLCRDGIRFMADSSRVMQGTAFLSSTLFRTYIYRVPENMPDPVFQIAFPALLETLQILGTIEASRPKGEYDIWRTNARWRSDPFRLHAMGVTGMCVLDWDEPGSPFIIRVVEANVKTAVDLHTFVAEMPDEIPFDHDAVAFRIIMQARLLADVMAELAITAPEKLTISVSRRSPYVVFSGHSDLGDSVVDVARGRRELLETFIVPSDDDGDDNAWMQTYRYDLLRLATEAMRIASKVAFRGDAQGVVSWNFMIDAAGEFSRNSFVKFDFVPYARGIDDDDDDGEGGYDDDDDDDEADEADEGQVVGDGGGGQS